MKTFRTPTLRHLLPPAILAVCLLVIYLRTLAPGLTWANEGSDGGDLIAAAATGGVAHPTGYPLYLLLARLFQFLPLGSLAFRTNLMSTAAAVSAALLVYKIVSSHSQGSAAWLSGMTAGIAFGLAPLVWSQAVITEVYALQALLTTLILFLYTRPAPSSEMSQRRLDLWRGLVLGLAMGNHLTTLLIVPAALLLGSLRTAQAESAARSWLSHLKFDREALFRQLETFTSGLCIYLILPLRALSEPPVNWGDPITLSRFWWLVSGQLYQSYYLQFSLAQVWGRFQASAGLLLDQFGLSGIILSLTGLVVFGARSRLYALTIWMAAASLAFTFIYTSIDFYVYLIPLLLAFAVWIGLGTDNLVRALSARRMILGLGLGIILIAYFAGRSAAYWSTVDASHDQRAETFGRQVLAAAPQNAILFAKGDEAVFTLWYFRFALKERPDLVVVAEDLLHFDWYQTTLRATYPSLVIPGSFPWPETIRNANPSRAVCTVEYTDQPKFSCSLTGIGKGFARRLPEH